MGGDQTKLAETPKIKDPLTWSSVVVDGYDTRYCLPGCKEKCYSERHDSLHAQALKRSPLWNNIILFKSGMALQQPVKHYFFSNSDVCLCIIEQFVRYTVQERLEQSTTIHKPWKILPLYTDRSSNWWVVNSPVDCIYITQQTGLQIVHSNGKRYGVPGYFWYDDVYWSLQCPCPLAKRSFIADRQKARKHPYSRHIVAQIAPRHGRPYNGIYMNKKDEADLAEDDELAYEKLLLSCSTRSQHVLCDTEKAPKRQ